MSKQACSVNGANSNPGKDKSIYLRGAKSDYTLIMMDGVPVYDATGTSSNFDLQAMMPIDNIERIEILKGSHSTLYGSDAVAGVINIITRKEAASKIVSPYATAILWQLRDHERSMPALVAVMIRFQL